jgi:hypothetical protein
MKGAFLAFALLAAPGVATPMACAQTIAVHAHGEVPGFKAGEAAPWLAQQMEFGALPGWHYTAGDQSSEAPDRVEWHFELQPFAGGGTRQYFPQAGVAKAHYLVIVELRLFLKDQYQTMVSSQETVAGGANDPLLAHFIDRTSRMLQQAWQATEVPEPPTKAGH